MLQAAVRAGRVVDQNPAIEELKELAFLLHFRIWGWIFFFRGPFSFLATVGIPGRLGLDLRV